METIADHAYMPDEHAPDPVMGHGDPTAPGKIGIWLFLASEIMFFIGILGSYIVLRSASHEMFSKMAQVLNKTLAGTNTLVLILSSLTMALAVDAAQNNKAKKAAGMLFITFLCSCGFMVIKGIEYNDKWHHNTIVARESGPTGAIYVYDGHVLSEDATTIELNGYRKTLVPGMAFDIHLIAPADVKTTDDQEETVFKIPIDTVSERINYFPWKNMFFACYFTLTGVHGIHVLGGMIAIFLLLAQALRGKLFPAQTEYVGLYWHFVDLVWIFLFPLLYLI